MIAHKKKASLLSALLCGCFFVGGCTFAADDADEPVPPSAVSLSDLIVQDGFVIPEWKDGVQLTESQLSVATGVGFSQAERDEMLLRGMNRYEYYHIVPAEAALAYMSDKYGIEFVAADSYLDSSAEENGVVTLVVPTEGDHAGEEYRVRCAWNAGEVCRWSEEYFADYIAEAYNDYISDQLQDAIAACRIPVVVKAEPNAYGLSDGTLGPQTPIDEAAGSMVCKLYIVSLPDEGMSQEEYRSEIQIVLNAAAATGVPMTYDAIALTELYEGEELTVSLGKAEDHAAVMGEDSRLKWRDHGTISNGNEY